MRIGGISSAVAAVTATALVGAALAQAAGSVPVKAGSYAGTSSEHGAVTFSITGRAIGKFTATLGYSGKCGQGAGPGYNVSVNGVAIAKNGTFSKNFTLVSPDQGVSSAAGKLTGRVSGTKVTGSIVDETLNKPGKCNGYTMTFSASLK